MPTSASRAVLRSGVGQSQVDLQAGVAIALVQRRSGSAARATWTSGTAIKATLRVMPPNW